MVLLLEELIVEFATQNASQVWGFSAFLLNIFRQFFRQNTRVKDWALGTRDGHFLFYFHRFNLVKLRQIPENKFKLPLQSSVFLSLCPITTSRPDLSAPEATDFHDYKARERSGWHALIRPLIPCSQSHCVKLQWGWKGCPQWQIGLNKTLAAEQ